jgi:hypothetical protein
MFEETLQLVRLKISRASFLCIEFFKRLGRERSPAHNKNSITGNKLALKYRN